MVCGPWSRRFLSVNDKVWLPEFGIVIRPWRDKSYNDLPSSVAWQGFFRSKNAGNSCIAQSNCCVSWWPDGE